MGMKLRCLEGGGGGGSTYLLLPSINEASSSSSSSSSSSHENKDSSETEKQEELCFYNDDGSWQKVMVEEHLVARYLCQLLSVKNRVPKDQTWTIVEFWPSLGLERCLEDHEEVLKVHRQTPGGDKKFIFRKQPSKYELFTNPQDVFPQNMNLVQTSFLELEDSNSNNLESLLDLEELSLAPFFSSVWFRDLNGSDWTKTFLLLKDHKLYMSSQIQVVAKLVRHWKNKTNNRYSTLDESPETCPLSVSEEYDAVSESSGISCGSWRQELELIGDVRDVEVYSWLNARRQARAPTEFGFALRPAHKEDFGSALCISTLGAKDKAFWITAMRLAKYGKQLRENYRSYKNKQAEQSSPKDYNRHSVPNESVRSRVAMDFTGSVGRIVDDPSEAKAIALSEGIAWKKRWRTSNANLLRRTGCGNLNATRVNGEAEVHENQPWFHKGMSRQEAANLVSCQAGQDGVFLVRESKSSPGCYVLTFKCASKVVHMPIQPIMDVVRDTVCYTLDSGVTKFYDILQLVEFYQLNAGCLPTRLTHYLCLQ